MLLGFSLPRGPQFFHHQKVNPRQPWRLQEEVWVDQLLPLKPQGYVCSSLNFYISFLQIYSIYVTSSQAYRFISKWIDKILTINFKRRRSLFFWGVWWWGRRWWKCMFVLFPKLASLINIYAYGNSPVSSTFEALTT